MDKKMAEMALRMTDATGTHTGRTSCTQPATSNAPKRGMPPITKEQWEEAQRVYYADKAAEHTYKGQRKAGWMAGAGSVQP